MRLLTVCLSLVVSLLSHAGAAEGLELFKDFGNKLGLAQESHEFLEPDRAFVLSVDTASPSTVVARWRIADGYYLYRDKFSFEVVDKAVKLGAVDYPSGELKEDLTFGRVEVYRGLLELTVPVDQRQPSPQSIELRVAYQGCADAGICYPPIEKQLPLELAAISLPSTPQVDDAARAAKVVPISKQDGIARELANQALVPVLLSFFGFGLLLAFTPCVFPMLPILSGILVGRGKEISTRSAFSLSLVYVLAMAFTYALAGVIAGLFGHNLQALFQAPWVLASFSALFVLLALSMFGLFDIQLPGRWQTRLTEAAERQTRGTLHGVAVMGVFSAIIVGPCVAPPLAGALVYIGQSGDGVIGGAALFSMALGMGAPLLAVGTSAGRLLPKAGPWMENVKKVFGVIMLGLAIWLLERILPAPLTLFLWGLLLVGAAVFMGALDGIGAVASNWQRLSKGLGIVSLIYGSVLVVAAAGGATDVFRPLQSMQIAIGNTEVNTGVKFKSIKGVGALREELAAAKARHKAVMLDFYADWCTECKRLERHTFADSRVQHRLANAILLKADVTANDEQDRELLRAMGLHGPPAVLFFGPDAMEKRAFRLAGFLGPEEFTAHVQRALAL